MAAPGRMSKPSAASKSLPALTGMRGVAALWVVAFHLAPPLGKLVGVPVDWPVLREGYLGVDVFFILSGFILCHAYASAFRRYTVREHLHFLLVRLARIYPLHAFAMAVLAAIVVALPGFVERYNPTFFRAPGFVIAALMLQNWAPHQLIWNAPAWSLSAEWAAYLVFPLPLLWTRRIRQGRHALLLAALALVLMALLFVVPGRTINATGKAGFLRLAGEFTAGCLIYRAYQSGLLGSFPWARGNWVALFLLGAVLLYPPAVPFVVLPFAFLIVSLAHRQGRLHRVLSSPPAMFLGEISYSVYLFHWMLIQVAEWYADRAGLAGAAAAVWLCAVLAASVLVVSTLTWRWVERPARSFGRRLADRLAPQPGMPEEPKMQPVSPAR